MMVYESYMEKKALLEDQLSRERVIIATAVLAEIRQCIQEFGFTQSDLFPDESKGATRKRRAKYFNPETGETWSGVGKEPRWLRGKDRDQFALDAAPEEDRREPAGVQSAHEAP
jgi:DNA-binding protein H-NS